MTLFTAIGFSLAVLCCSGSSFARQRQDFSIGGIYAPNKAEPATSDDPERAVASESNQGASAQVPAGRCHCKCVNHGTYSHGELMCKNVQVTYDRDRDSGQNTLVHANSCQTDFVVDIPTRVKDCRDAPSTTPEGKYCPAYNRGVGAAQEHGILECVGVPEPLSPRN